MEESIHLVFPNNSNNIKIMSERNESTLCADVHNYCVAMAGDGYFR